MYVGIKIKNARKSKNLSQKQLGELIGTSYQNIAQWENGFREPKLESIFIVADALKMNPFELLPDWFIERVNEYATP